MTGTCICGHPRADHQTPAVELGVTAECDLCPEGDCPNYTPDNHPAWASVFPDQTCRGCGTQHPGQTCHLQGPLPLN